MKIKEQTLKELEALNSSEMHVVYELILSLKSRMGSKHVEKPHQAYQKVRNILKACTGSLSKDVLEARADRV